jgi:hypothetical protein
MFTVDPKLPLLALNGAPLRRVAVNWRDTLRTVSALAQRSPGVSTAQVLDHAAKVISEAEGTGMTLGDAVIDALLSGKAAEECTGTEKLRRWELALKFRGGDSVALTAEQVTFIEGRLAEYFTAAVFGPARDALNGVTR